MLKGQIFQTRWLERRPLARRTLRVQACLKQPERSWHGVRSCEINLASVRRAMDVHAFNKARASLTPAAGRPNSLAVTLASAIN